MSDYKDLFLEELQEQIQLMDDEILKLEQNGATDQGIQSLFRAAHTLKGSSAAMGYDAIKTVTHQMEHLLDQVRNRQLSVNGAFIDLFFRAMDCLKRLQKNALEHDSSPTDITDCLNELKAFSGNGSPADASSVETPRPDLRRDIRPNVAEALEQGFSVHRILVRIGAECAIKGARAFVVRNHLNEWGGVLESSPPPEEIVEDGSGPVSIEFLYAGVQSTQELQMLMTGWSDIQSVDIEPVNVEAVNTDTANANDLETHTEHAPAAASAPREGSPKPADAEHQTGSKKNQTIRVSVDRLEHLMNLVGELVIDQTRVRQAERTIRKKLADDSVDELGQISDHLTRIIGDLQESVMKARMLPIEQLFSRFPRMIRDLAKDLGKEIELVIEGKDTELDRTIIEEIADPLIHLIRNGVDHGIETADRRAQAGKSRKGTLRIKAAHEDNQVVIYVEDDGAGIDPGKMKRSALGKGLITEQEAAQLTDREAVELIFRPGFSTAQTVSDVSGRGVGMDIVRSHIQKLNGLIDIETTLGSGTRFKIKLPLTLAIITGLLVRLHEQTFIIPMSSIAEIVRVTEGDIHTVRGQEAILLRDRIIPVIWIHDLLQIPKTTRDKKHVPVVIVGSAEQRVAFAVDELLGNQEIVIKSFGSYIGEVNGLSGATILGDGKVALILNTAGIIAKMNNMTGEHQ